MKLVNYLKQNYIIVLAIVIVVASGVLTGKFLSDNVGSSSGDLPSNVKVTSNEAGIVDESTFKGDTVEGNLEEGGKDGEGSFHLTRDGGPSKNVYLTSSVIDLQSFVGKKVKVWGETLASRKAGWLMDVAKIKVIE